MGLSVASYVQALNKYRWYVIAFWIVIVTSGAYFASRLIRITTQEFKAPVGSQSDLAASAMTKYFPSSSTTSNYVTLVQCADTTSRNTSVLLQNPTVANLTLTFCEDMMAYKYNFRGNVTKPVSACLSYFNVPFEPVRSSFVSNYSCSMVINVQLEADFLSDVSDDFTTYILGNVKSKLEPALKQFDLAVSLSGLRFFLRSTFESVERDLGLMDAIVLPCAMLILSFFVRSLRLVLVPILSIGMSLGISFAIMYFVGTTVLKVSSIAPSLMMSVLIAMSIDYALFMLTRYREELGRGKTGEDCLVAVLRTAGHTITVSGLTLCTCFMSLCFFRLNMLVSLGIANAVVIVVTLLINVTFVPALFLAFKDFFEKSRPDVIVGDELAVDETTWSFKFGTIITRTPYNVIVVLVAIGLTIPSDLHAFGFNTRDSYVDYLPRADPVTAGYKQMGKAFGSGYLYPYQLLFVPRNGSVYSPEFFNKTASALIEMLSDPQLPQTNVHNAMGIMMQLGQPVSYAEFMNCLTNASMANVSTCQTSMYLSRGLVSPNGTATWVNIQLRIDPLGNDGDDWYKRFLELMKIQKTRTDCDIYLAGYGGESMDAIDDVYSKMPLMIAMSGIIVVVFLGLSFRSVLIPIRGFLTIFLTMVWIFGFAAQTYQDGIFDKLNISGLHSEGAISWSVPILAFAIVVGIGLDYDIFLLSRTMEYVEGGDQPIDAIVKGLSSTATIITAAGIIMAVAFSGLVASEMPALNQLGFFMVFSVLFDTFLVRTCLVPALMSLCGRWNWWPRHQQNGETSKKIEQNITLEMGEFFLNEDP
eukprot:PhF_6_TR42106/c0_g1_i1/m.63571/K06994/K06994; putative drug exporter of the RND superfamily